MIREHIAYTIDFTIAYLNYLIDYKRSIIQCGEEEYDPSKKGTDFILVEFSSYDLLETIYEDLIDKNFTETECNQLVWNRNKITDETAWKFLAYFFSLADEYETIEELKELIAETDRVYFTDEEIEKIFSHRYDFG